MIASMSRLPVHPLAGQCVGYARISSTSQNLDGRTDALAAVGCEKIFADAASGKLTERPELSLCLGYSRAGDTLVVWRLDRLGRCRGIWWRPSTPWLSAGWRSGLCM